MFPTDALQQDGQISSTEAVCSQVEFLKAMLRSGMRESQNGEVRLPDVAKGPLELVLSFAAQGRPKTFALPEKLAELEELIIASQFMLEKEVCALAAAKLDESLSKQNVDFVNWAQTFAFAARLGLNRMSESCFVFWLGNAFCKLCSACRPETVNWWKLASSNHEFKGGVCGASTVSCLVCNTYVGHFGGRCLVSGGSNCTHRNWQDVTDSALARNVPVFSEKAKVAFAELVSMGASEAIGFMFARAKSNFSIFADALAVIMTPGFPAEAFCDFIESSKQAAALFKKLTEARGDLFLQAFRNLRETRFAGLVLLAAARGRFFSEEVMKFVEKGRHLDYCDEQGSVLHEAVRMRSPLLCERLLLKGADVNLLCIDTPLQVAVSLELVDVIQVLLKHGANPNLKNRAGDLALIVAIGNGSVEIVKMLLQFGASPDLRSKAEENALCLAVEHKGPELVQILLDHGANPDWIGKSGETALYLAIQGDAFHIAQKLIERGAHPDLKGKNGETALHCAVTCKSVETAKLLLGSVADVNIPRSSDGKTALHLAVSLRLAELVAVLLAHEKIDVEARTLDGDSALILACASPADAQLFEMLLDRTVCFAACNKVGISALALLQREAKICTDPARLNVLVAMCERLVAKLAPCAVQ
jgi:ankyrin repeat protein